MTTEFLHFQGALSSPRAASNLSKGPSPAMVLTNKRNCFPNKSRDNLWKSPNFRSCSMDLSMDSCERPVATNPYRNWQNPKFKAILFGPCGKKQLIYMVGGLVVVVCSDTIETYHVCPNKNHHQKFHWKQIQLETCLFQICEQDSQQDSQWFKNQLSVCKRKTTPTINILHSSLFNTATPPYLVHLRDLQ